MMTNLDPGKDQLPAADPSTREDARDIQARLYREIGILAVAAALRFVNLPDPDLRPIAQPKSPDAASAENLAA